MRSSLKTLANPVLAAGFALCALPAGAQVVGAVSPRVLDLTAGIFCAPPEGERRPAPGTASGWVHVPEEPVAMVAEGVRAPTVLGLGFGVRYRLSDTERAPTRYIVRHPPVPPLNMTEESWEGSVGAGSVDTVFFQFDLEEEMQRGDWSFSVESRGELLFTVAFTVTGPAELPALAQICHGDTLLSGVSGVSPRGPGAAG